MSNESHLKELASQSNGFFCTMSKALYDLGCPTLKSVRPVTTYRGSLTIGKPDYGENALAISVERWPCIALAKPQTAHSFAVKSHDPTQQSAQSSITLQHASGDPELEAVTRDRAYQVLDPSAPGGKKDVSKDELEKGYEYGRTAVNISQADESVVKLETEPGLQVVGFVDEDKFGRYLEITPSSFVAAARGDSNAALALSSLVQALTESHTYAIARFVKEHGKPPSMCVLAPFCQPGYEGLIFAELPFSEDVRQYKFPPLDKVVTVGGKHITQHRNLPSDALKKAMSDYVDSMDLSNYGKDEDGYGFSSKD